MKPPTKKPPTPRTPPKKKKTRRGTQTQNQVTRVVDARTAREEEKQELGIGLRSLFLCGLPLRSLPTMVYKRTCGLYTLTIVGNPEYGGVPFGQDRLIPIWLATAFVHLGCPEDNTVRFVYARDILRTFGLPTDGIHYQRLREGILRFQGSLFTTSQEIKTRRGKPGIHLKQLPLLREVRLWYRDPTKEEENEPPTKGEKEPPTKVEKEPGPIPLFPEEDCFDALFQTHFEDLDDPRAPHTITLDPGWAKEIREHPVPVDLQTVRALRTHPGALDFYQWQAWRSFFAKTTIRIPLQGKNGLFAQFGALQEQPAFELRRRVGEWQRLIKLSWPTCPNSLSRDGKAFLIRHGRAVTASHQNRFVLRGLPGTPK